MGVTSMVFGSFLLGTCAGFALAYVYFESKRKKEVQEATVLLAQADPGTKNMPWDGEDLSRYDNTDLEAEGTDLSESEFSKLREVLSKYTVLKDNWDGRGALPVTESAVARTRRILLFMREHRLLKKGWFDIGPTKEGGIEFDFSYARSLLRLEVPPSEGEPYHLEAGYTDEEADYGYVPSINVTSTDLKRLFKAIVSESIGPFEGKGVRVFDPDENGEVDLDLKS